MFLNLLEMNLVATGLYTFILGLLITFFGISIIVLFVFIAGKIFSSSNKDKKSTEIIKEKQDIEITDSEEIPDYVKAAIVAAITAYYFNDQSNCEFRVKKIKRL